MVSGVYQIYNPITNKRYIGSSIDVYRRIKEHRRRLKSNRHENKHLQNAWNKYKYLLIFDILEFCEVIWIRECEQMYIDYYNSSDRNFGYNIDISAFNSSIKCSDETRIKISNSHKGKKLSKDHVAKIRLANTGQKRPTQSRIMKDRWIISKDYLSWNKLSEETKIITRKKLSVSAINRFKDFRNKIGNTFLKCTLDDEILYFYGYKDASRYFNIHHGAINYAFKYSNGIVYKIHAKFEKIDMDEYMKNKVTGER